MDGWLIGCGDDPLVAKIAREVGCHTVLYGIDTPVNWIAQDIAYDRQGCASYRAVYNNQDMGWFNLKVPGRHNIYNALAATASAWALGIPYDIIRDALFSYTGTHRRFEIIGTTRDGITVIDDYAHHPAEVKATLQAIDNFPHDKLWCVFQPHTYSRTKLLFKEFTEAFDNVDTVIVTDIYSAREKDTGEINARELADAIRTKGQNCLYIPSFENIASYLKDHAASGDIVLTMGAGNVNEVGKLLLAQA
jgi:UDP-N-acetylmuramate--alanine ligase